MGSLVNPLVNAIGGKFLNKALGHGARAKRAAGEKEIAQQESTKLNAQVSYECIRRVDASIAAGTSNPTYLNLGRGGGKTSVGDEVACFHAAQDLGAQFTGREFDDASGKPLYITHPEFYQQTTGTVPSNSGSPMSRGAGAGIQQAVNDARNADSPGQQTYLQTDVPMSPVNPGGTQQAGISSGKNMWVIIILGILVLLGLFASRK